MKHLVSLAEELATRTKDCRNPDWSRLFELKRILGQEINRLSADDFQEDAKAEFLTVQDKFRGVAAKSTLSDNDCLPLHEMAARVVRVLNKYEEQGGQTGTMMSEITIENFQGILGNVIQSTVEQNVNLKVAKHDFQAVSDALQKIGLGQDDVAELKTALQKDPEPEKPNEYGPKVSAWFGKIMQKVAGGAYELSIATAGGLLSELLLKYYGFH